MELPARTTLKPFCPHDIKFEYVKSTNSTTNLPMSFKFESNPVISLLFLEYGPASGMPYHLKTNHRLLDTVHFEQHRIGQNGERLPPLSESAVSKDPAQSFDAISGIMFLPYQIQRKPNKWHPLSANTMCSASAVVPRANKSHRMYDCYLRDVVGEDVTAKGFKRTLAVFGYKWCDGEGNEFPDSTPVKAVDIACFLELFVDCAVTSKETFTAFVEKFQLEKFIEWSDIIDWEPEVMSQLPSNWKFMEKARALCNMARLCKLLRGLYNFRVSIPEGQHRFFFCSYILNGYTKLDNVIPLQPRTADITANFIYENWSVCQVFKNMKMSVVAAKHQPESSNPLPSVIQNLPVFRNIGEVVTGAGKYSIPVSICNLNDELVKEIKESIIKDECDADAWSFEKFWTSKVSLEDVDVVMSYLEFAKDNLLGVTNEKPDYQGILNGMTQTAWKDNEDKIGAVVTTTTSHPMTSKGPNTSHSSVNGLTLAFIHLIRAHCTSVADLMILQQLFHRQTPFFKQCNSHVLGQQAVNTTLEWYKNVALPCICQVDDYYSQRFDQDLIIASKVRKASTSKQFQEWFHGKKKGKDTIDSWLNGEEKGKDTIDETLINKEKKEAFTEYVENGGYIEDTKRLVIPDCRKLARERGTFKSNASRRKAKLASMTTFVTDFTDTLIQYGNNPDFKTKFQATANNRVLKDYFNHLR